MNSRDGKRLPSLVCRLPNKKFELDGSPRRLSNKKFELDGSPRRVPFFTYFAAMLTVTHPWHGVHYGVNAPRVVNAIIEIPQGSRAKYEIDKDSGLLKLDRIIYSSFYYPCNYGFIPQTYGDDKDPLDILVITSFPVQAMCLMEAKVLGVMHMVDSGDADDKIIAVAANDPSVKHYNNLEELPKHFFDELRHFFEEYKKLENKTVRVDELGDKHTALNVINDAIKLYADTFRKKS